MLELSHAQCVNTLFILLYCVCSRRHVHWCMQQGLVVRLFGGEAILQKLRRARILILIFYGTLLKVVEARLRRPINEEAIIWLSKLHLLQLSKAVEPISARLFSTRRCCRHKLLPNYSITLNALSLRLRLLIPFKAICSALSFVRSNLKPLLARK